MQVSDEFIRIKNLNANYTEEYIYQDAALVMRNTKGNEEFLHNGHEGSSDLITVMLNSSCG